jgi:ribonuclease G
LALRWFRRRLQDFEQAAANDDASDPHTPDQLVTGAGEPVEAEAAVEQPRRRRGTRGGRGRKRKADDTPTQAVAAPAPPDAERKPKPTPKARRVAPRRSEPRRKQPTRRAPLPKARRELLISVSVTEQRVAVLEDGRVAEVYLERPDRRSIAGNIYKGVVDNVLPGMEAAFVEIGLEKNGFLYVDEIVGPELEGKRQGRRIQDLLSRGQELLVQAVKDPMKTKGARLTTEISLPGRFVVYVPQGEGIGVSRRLDEDERARLRDILKALELPKGGVIVRTAAEGASAEDIERDVVFLQKLWKQIQAHAKESRPPALLYQEAELPLRVVRDLFTEDFERALIDDDLTLKRVTGYLKKTSPHMAERVSRFRERTSLFEAFGVDDEIRSTLRRRVDLPSGGYLVFDYAEAFTVVDVNTGRFVGSRSRASTARLEDTITKNNLEAVREVVRQLRLRDIGGIIVIDFIDMANPKNRGLVEEALKRELERDRTKTYVVEISPLGLVEMTRQNVTEGPREILTRRCPTCDGDGIVISEASAAVEAESRLRMLAAQSPRTKAFRVELNARVAALLIGPGAQRLMAIEDGARRRFFLDDRDDVPLDHFVVAAKGPLDKVAPQGPVAEGDEREVKLVEVGLHDPTAGVAKLDGCNIAVGAAAGLVGKKVKVRIERVLDGAAYAALVGGAAAGSAPITAEELAEKPTRRQRPRAEKTEEAAGASGVADDGSSDDDGVADRGDPETPGEAPKRKRTRRGSRGGKRRRKTPSPVATDTVDSTANGPVESVRAEAIIPTIHVPDSTLGSEAEQVQNGGEAAAEAGPKRKRTRRGSRGGRRRKKTAAVSAATEGAPEPDE